MIELFTQRRSDYFRPAPLGIHSIPGHFLRLEKELEKTLARKTRDSADVTLTNQVEAEKVLFNDSLFRALVVQRSRAYVEKSQKLHGGSNVTFPKREDPKVVNYSIKRTLRYFRAKGSSATEICDIISLTKRLSFELGLI